MHIVRSDWHSHAKCGHVFTGALASQTHNPLLIGHRAPPWNATDNLSERSLPQSHTCATAVLGDELHAGAFDSARTRIGLKIVPMVFGWMSRRARAVSGMCNYFIAAMQA
jgi:hypothetical protein